jgi:hypothetical protein
MVKRTSSFRTVRQSSLAANCSFFPTAGIRLPNHGQDFATVTVRLDPRLFGFPEAEKIPVDPSLDLKRVLAENSSPSDAALLP